MKTFALILILGPLSAAFSQSKSESKLVNEFDPRRGCESLERDLDDLFAEAYPTALDAVVVIHGGDNVIDTAKVYRKATNYGRFVASNPNVSKFS